MKKYIEINLTYQGTHNWPQVNIEAVSYLKHEHRHLFYIKLIKEVAHNEREIEIISFKNEVEAYLAGFNSRFGSKSCESIAELLLIKFNCSEVEVLEDGENGAVLKNYA
jgi:hypothetical protein